MHTSITSRYLIGYPAAVNQQEALKMKSLHMCTLTNMVWDRNYIFSCQVYYYYRYHILAPADLERYTRYIHHMVTSK